MYEDISRLVGEVTIQWLGREFRLRPFGFDDYSAVQSFIANAKRERVLKAVQDIKGTIPYPDWRELFVTAMEQTENTGDMTQPEFDALTRSDEGLALLLWSMLEKSYPGVCRREDCSRMLRDGTVTDAAKVAIAQQVRTAIRARSIDWPEATDVPMPDKIRDARGWRYLLWRACRSPLNDPPGLGMAWGDAMKAGPLVLLFLLSSEETVDKMSRQMRANELQALGVTAEDIRAGVREYQATKRAKYGGAEPVASDEARARMKQYIAERRGRKPKK